MIETRPFDVQNYLQTPEDRAAYLEAILEECEPSLIAKAVCITEFARQSGLIPGGNPTLDTLAKATKAFGLRLAVTPAE